jgi:O-antigen biosynthesis protein
MKSISVVIPNYKINPLKKHLPSIIKACPNTQIIVVDDASPDNAASYFKKNFPKVKVIKNKKNQRFAENCNIGFRAATGEIVVLLNSDVAPFKNFLNPLASHFDDDKVFSVGCLEVEIHNGKKVFTGKNSCRFKRGFLIHSGGKITNTKKVSNNCWTSGGSMAVDRKKYLELGGMDTLYKPAYWEDIDLSYQARKRGYKVLFDPRSKVNHNHETTNLTVFGKRNMEITSMRNQILFVYKNIRGKQLLEHFLWLPYHLIFTTYRTKGVFLIALWRALIAYINTLLVIKRRKNEKNN